MNWIATLLVHVKTYAGIEFITYDFMYDVNEISLEHIRVGSTYIATKDNLVCSDTKKNHCFIQEIQEML